MEPWRKLYDALRDEYTGGSSGFDVQGQRPINYIFELITGVLPDLAPETIRTQVIPLRSDQAAQAEVMSLSLDADAREMRLAEELDQAAQELMFAPFALVRVGRHEGLKTVELDGEEVSVEEAFCNCLLLHDLTVDMAAKRWETRRYVAERIVISRARCAALNPFGRDIEEAEPLPEGVQVMTRAEAAAAIAAITSRAKEWASGDATEATGKDSDHEDSEDGDALQVWSFAIYDGNTVWTAVIADTDDQPAKFLTFSRHRGHPRGPYEMVRLHDRRGGMLGLPGCGVIFDLHQAAKKLGNKVVRQLMNLKNLGVGSKADEGDGMAIRRADDQDLLLLNNPKAIGQLLVGGTRPELFEGLGFMAQQFGNLSGNVRQQSGTEAAKSGSATVSTFLQAGGAKRIRRAQARMKGLGDRIIEQVAFRNLFADVNGYKRVEMPLQTGGSIPVEIFSDEMAADILAFTFRVQAWPGQLADPLIQSQRVQAFFQLVAQLMPFIQLGLVKIPALARIGRSMFGIEDIDDLLADPTGIRRQIESGAFAGVPVPAMQNNASRFGGGGGGGGQTGQRPIDEARSALAPTAGAVTQPGGF